MKSITNKQYEEWMRFQEDKAKGRAFTSDTVRFICESCNYDPRKIGEYMLEILPKVCPLPDYFYEERFNEDPELKSEHA